MENMPDEHKPEKSYRSPILESLDYDDCRIYCPFSGKYVTMLLKGITDEFLQSKRTDEDVEIFGIHVTFDSPYSAEMGIDVKEKVTSNQSLQADSLTKADMAKILGITEKELVEAYYLGRDALLEGIKTQTLGKR